MRKIEEMAQACFEVGLSPGTYHDLPESGQTIMLSRMVAVLKVLREPNAEMAAAIGRAVGTDERAIVLSVWYALIDTVLEEKP